MTAVAPGGGDITATRIPYVRVTGEPFDVGYQHGRSRARALHAFLDDDLARKKRKKRIKIQKNWIKNTKE